MLEKSPRSRRNLIIPGVSLAIAGLFAINTPGIKENFLSSDPSSYDLKVKVGEEVCYTSQTPKKSYDSKTIFLKDALCPTETSSNTKFSQIAITTGSAVEIIPNKNP